MFIHNFKYSLITLFKDKILIFWTFAFPIILGTFFNLAFSNIENSEAFKAIDIAIVDNEKFQENEIYKEAFKQLSDVTSDDQIFNIKYTSSFDAVDMLESDEIDGYITFDEGPKVVIKSNGVNQTIIHFVTEEIKVQESIYKEMIESKIKKSIKENPTVVFNYEALTKKIFSEVENMVKNSDANIKNISSENMSYTMIEFYTLIAMTCLYGGILGLVSINKNLANMSNNGKRVSVSPTSKGVLILSSVLAGYLTQLIGVALLFIYTIFVLHIDYGSSLSLIVLLALVGSLAGLTLGIAIATLFKTNENLKTGIVIAVTMMGCFLSGMMGITMKYIIDTNVPILNKINPASMITDGFYSLYYYPTNERFYFNIVSLLIFSCFMILLSMFSLRRQKYDSI